MVYVHVDHQNSGLEIRQSIKRTPVQTQNKVKTQYRIKNYSHFDIRSLPNMSCMKGEIFYHTEFRYKAIMG